VWVLESGIALEVASVTIEGTGGDEEGRGRRGVEGEKVTSVGKCD